MRAMLWKELRENLRWAILAALALGAAEFYGLQLKQLFNYGIDTSETLCKATFLMGTTFGSAAVGLVLGLVQILPEQRRDQWAALIHRPVPRSTIYQGKVAAGLVLYFLAAGLPFAFCAWYAATPGHFAAPFVMGMIKPGVADIAGGAVFYLAAVVLALQRGPWYGARMLALLAAVAASMATHNFESFSWALVEDAVVAILLFAAGWGAITQHELLWKRPRLTRWAWLLVCLSGSTTLVLLGWGLVGLFSPPHYSYEYSQYIVDDTYRVLLVKNAAQGQRTIEDLNGQKITDPQLTSTRTFYQHVLQAGRVSPWIGKPPHGDFSPTWHPYRQNRTYVLNVASRMGGNGQEAWFYVHSQRLLVGFSEVKSRPVGFYDRGGFKLPTVTNLEPFPEPLFSSAYYVDAYDGKAFTNTKTTLYQFDLDQDRLITTLPTSSPIWGAEKVRFGTGNQADSESLVPVALTSKMEVYNWQGSLVATLPYQHDVSQWGNLQLSIKPRGEGYFLHYLPSSWLDYREQSQRPTYLDELDAQGNVLHSYTLPPLPLPRNQPRTWQQYLTESWEAPATFFGSFLYQGFGHLIGSQTMEGNLQWRLHEGHSHTLDVMKRILLASLFFASVALGLARWKQFPWKRALAWAAFVFIFNLGGLITFVLAADWPTLVRCPVCQRKRPAQEAACTHCGAAWPTPVPDGTEILQNWNEPVIAER